MAKKKAEEKKPSGPVFTVPPSLHGRNVKLVREGEEVVGVLMSKDSQNPDGGFMFKWKNKGGQSTLSSVSKEELEKLLNGK